MAMTGRTSPKAHRLVTPCNSAFNSGTVIKSSVTGALSAAVPLMATNLGTGASFRVNDETGDTDITPFLIDATGKVGIGTTDPQDFLHLFATTPRIRLEDNAGGYSTLDADSGKLEIGADQGNTVANSYLGFKVDSVEAMRITESGNVGIGTTTPSEKLTVSISLNTF